ncbi:MAG: hypothetical protein L3J95_05635 [Thermoplasmata archaeon]|nr:hypothetical protein [Thermoplasmata archaeon]MCI4359879.1 hypothetical protein [Thermoplasmata archaeon]
MTAHRSGPRRECELAPAVQAHLEALGYRVWIDPDGTDYYDVVARKDRSIALVELKLADGKAVLGQAIRRRGWAEWVAVAVPTEALARRIAQRPVAERGRRVGVWWVDGSSVRVVRPALALVREGEVDPFGPLKEQMNERLDLVEAGHLPLGIAWNLLAASRSALPGRRSTRDWRIEEFSEAEAPSAEARASDATEGRTRPPARTGPPSSHN